MLEKLDEEGVAQRVASAGCLWCEGPLHRGDYARKPRGALIAPAGEAFVVRFSLCCGREGCRKRATPPSLRFLGRRVYLGVVVIVASLVAQALGTAEASRHVTDEPQIVQRWQADGSLVPSKLSLVNGPYSDQLGKSAPLLDEGHYLVGICAFENWPGRIHSPNDSPALREFDLFIEPSYRRYIGFMQNFRDPRDVFPGDFPLLDMDFSD